MIGEIMTGYRGCFAERLLQHFLENYFPCSNFCPTTEISAVYEISRCNVVLWILINFKSRILTHSLSFIFIFLLIRCLSASSAHRTLVKKVIFVCDRHSSVTHSRIICFAKECSLLLWNGGGGTATATLA